MKNTVLATIRQNALLDGCKEVTVALSGGADSMALLNLMLELREELSVTVSAAHFNHKIRGDEAERDMNFVKAYCEKMGVKLFCGEANVPEIANRTGLSLELAARQERYKFLKEVATGVVATAHTMSDNLETVIFNLARGSALEGLCGIPLKRDIFIRPLLNCSREQVEYYCKMKNIPFVTDSTNLTDDYTRNKIRHKVVPILKEINPAAETAVMRTCESLSELSADLKRKAQSYLENNSCDKGLCLEGFNDLEVSLAKWVLKLYLQENTGASLESVHIAKLYEKAVLGGRTSLPKDYYANIRKGFLILEKKGEIGRCDTHFHLNLEEKEIKSLEELQKINNLFLNNCLDCDKIVGKAVLRTRESGDKIRLAGRGCTKSLNRLFSEDGVDIALRDRLPVLADDRGIIWIYGYGASQRCAITGKTKRVLLINEQKDGEKE